MAGFRKRATYLFKARRYQIVGGSHVRYSYRNVTCVANNNLIQGSTGSSDGILATKLSSLARTISQFMAAPRGVVLIITSSACVVNLRFAACCRRRITHALSSSFAMGFVYLVY